MSAHLAQPTEGLTEALCSDLQDIGVKAVRSGDLTALKLLNAMKVDLSPALSHAVRLDLHEMIAGLRRLGVPVSADDVDWAVSRSTESYWSLCGAEGKPLFAETALEVALREGKFALVDTLLDRWRTRVTAHAVDAIAEAKRPVPRDLIEKVFAAIPESELTEFIALRAAQLGTTPIMDRVLRVIPGCNPEALTAIAFKSQNVSVARDLYARAPKVGASILHHYACARYGAARANRSDDDHCNEVDLEFLRWLKSIDVSCRLDDTQPMLDTFLTRLAALAQNFEPPRETSVEQECLQVLRSLLEPDECAALSLYLGTRAQMLAAGLLPRSLHARFESHVQAFIEGRAPEPLEPAFEVVGFAR